MNRKVEIQIFSFYSQGMTKGYAAAISGITETFKHASHKYKRWPLILTPSRFSCDKASTEAGKI